MRVSVKYISKHTDAGPQFREYGNPVSPAKSYTIELTQRESAERPKATPFPHKSDIVSLVYKFDPRVMWDIDGGPMSDPRTIIIDGATLAMSLEEAEELAHLLIYSVQQAKLTKAPVECTITRDKRGA